MQNNITGTHENARRKGMPKERFISLMIEAGVLTFGDGVRRPEDESRVPPSSDIGLNFRKLLVEHLPELSEIVLDVVKEVSRQISADTLFGYKRSGTALVVSAHTIDRLRTDGGNPLGYCCMSSDGTITGNIPRGARIVIVDESAVSYSGIMESVTKLRETGLISREKQPDFSTRESASIAFAVVGFDMQVLDGTKGVPRIMVANEEIFGPARAPGEQRIFPIASIRDFIGRFGRAENDILLRYIESQNAASANRRHGRRAEVVCRC